MKKSPAKKVKKVKIQKKPILQRVISKIIAARKKPVKTTTKNISHSAKDVSDVKQTAVVTDNEKFTVTKENITPTVTLPQINYRLPVKYGDNRIVILPRDPWWIYSYWDITQGRIDEVIFSLPDNQRQGLKWILRVYDVSGISFNGNNANSFFDLDINFDTGNWYVNISQPEREWCVEIGFKDPSGRFYPVARSNVIKTPYFGISSVIDEEWALPDEDYYKVLGVYDLGKSSMERKKRFEEIVKHQISSPLASWGVSSFSERPQEQDKFFLEVWTELILYGRTESDAHVTVEGKKVDLRKDGTFSLRYALPVGDYKFEVVGTSSNKKHKIKKVPAVKRFNKED